jgi:hypothetical protein
MQWVLQDLVFMRESGVLIDRETFDSVLAYENCNRNLIDCLVCGTPSMGQHASFCPDASVLWTVNWFEIVQAREAR